MARFAFGAAFPSLQLGVLQHLDLRDNAQRVTFAFEMQVAFEQNDNLTLNKTGVIGAQFFEDDNANAVSVNSERFIETITTPFS